MNSVPFSADIIIKIDWEAQMERIRSGKVIRFQKNWECRDEC
jgi:hypothetical protein